jgi:flagellar biosynthesis protein FlhF
MNGPSEIADIRAKLHDTGMDTALVRQLTEAAMATRTPHPVRTSSAPESDSLHAAVRREMEKRITVDSHLGREGSRRTVVAFVGPPGRGKTTTLVKVAITCGLAKRIPVRIFSMDARRIAAEEQMRSYAAILAVPFQSFENVAGLDQALAAGWGQDARTETLTLIDTAGYGPGEMAEAGQLAAYLASNSEIDVHLVLRADTRTADLVRGVERYSMFRPGKLIFTGLDEAESFGAGFSAAVRCGLPVSFLSAGQRVPEDIYPAAGGQLAGLVLTGGAYQKRAAA